MHEWLRFNLDLLLLLGHHLILEYFGIMINQSKNELTQSLTYCHDASYSSPCFLSRRRHRPGFHPQPCQSDIFLQSHLKNGPDNFAERSHPVQLSE